jgi:hypothetical protein
VPALVIPSLWADRVLATAPCKLTHLALTDAAEQQMWAAFPISTKLQPFTRIINQRYLYESMKAMTKKYI